MSYEDTRFLKLDPFLPLIKDLNALVHMDRECGNLTCLLYAIALSLLETVRKLTRAGAIISLPAMWRISRTPLQAAAQAGSKEIVEYILGEGASAKEPIAARAGAAVLQIVAINGKVPIATILLRAEAETNAQPAFSNVRTAFEGATEYGRFEMMLLLADNGADLI